MQAGGREFESLSLHSAEKTAGSRTLKTEYREESIKPRRNRKMQKHQKYSFERETSETKKEKSITHATLDMIDEGLSEEERRADALALRAEERRDKLRKAAGSGKYTEIRRFLNGETHVRRPYVPYAESIGIRGEPGELKHLSSRRRRKKHRFPK